MVAEVIGETRLATVEGLLTLTSYDASMFYWVAAVTTLLSLVGKQSSHQLLASEDFCHIYLILRVGLLLVHFGRLNLLRDD